MYHLRCHPQDRLQYAPVYGLLAEWCHVLAAWGLGWADGVKLDVITEVPAVEDVKLPLFRALKAEESQEKERPDN